MLRVSILLAALTLTSSASAQTAINDRPAIVAVGQGQASQTPDFARIGFQVRGEGANPAEALAALAEQRARIEAGVRSLKGMAGVEINSTQISTQDVRRPDCSRTQPYLAAQQLSTGDCTVVGAIATLDLEVKVQPASRAGDTASMAAQLGAKQVGMRGTGLLDETVLQHEALAKAAADARREAETMARAAGVHLGPMLRVQDSSTNAISPLAYSDAAAVAQSPLPPPPPPPPLATPLAFVPQPIARTARVTVIYALEPGSAAP